MYCTLYVVCANIQNHVTLHKIDFIKIIIHMVLNNVYKYMEIFGNH